MDRHFDGELLVVLRSFFVDGAIDRRSLPACLHDLLQARFRVDGGRTAAQVHLLTDCLEDEALSDGHATVHRYRADDGLEEAGEVLGSLAAAGSFFAPAEEEELAEAKLSREGGKAVAPDEIATPSRQLSFLAGRAVTEEAVGDDVAEDGVAEELEALVRFEALGKVLVEVGAVHEGLAKEAYILELDAEAFLDFALEGHD
jgi:hypothetical protein